MGKGKRIREERQQGLDARQAVGELFQIEGASEFLAWNERYTSHRRAILERLTEWCEKPTMGPSFRPWHLLVAAAANEPEVAWEEMERTRSDLAALETNLEADLDEAVVTLEGGDPQGAIGVIDQAVLRTGMLPLLHGAFELLRASALASCRDRPLARRQEEGIAALNRALECATPGERAAWILRPLANLWAERQEGDRRRNLGVAIDLYRLALSEIEGQDCDEIAASLQTQLAMALLRRDDGDRRSRLEEALALCKTALQTRTLDADPQGWAHAQINRAAVVAQLAQLSDASREEAESIYEEVIAQAEAFDDYLLLAGAHYELARSQRGRAHRTPEDMLEIYTRGNDEKANARERSLLCSATEHLAIAESLLLANKDDSSARPRLLAERTVVMEMLGEREAALAAGREAMGVLSPTETPRACLDAGTKLGAMLVEAGQWEEAAAIYRPTINAAELLFQTSLSREARAFQTQSFGHLGRWASLAFAANDDLEEAVLALEGSRTRELRFRLTPGTGDPEALAELPAELREEYESAAAEFAAAAPLTSEEADESRLQTALASIRVDPRFKDFLRGPRIDQIYADIEEGWPLLYVNPTPLGTLLLTISPAPEPKIEARFLETPTSTEVFLKLLGAPEEGEEIHTSYLNAAGSFGKPQPNLEDAIDQVEPWIGKNIAQTIAEQLDTLDARGVTLIISGPLATFPLGAASWTSEGRSHRLLDQWEVRYAPSATVAALSHQRLRERERQAPFLVGLGNPLGDLVAARAEIEEIAIHFDRAAELAHGLQADAAFLRANVQRASHLHLACHGAAAVFAPEEVGVELSDGLFSAADLAAVGGLRTRLAVLSACQTAVPDIGQLPGEAISTSTALLLAGSASVIATLWPVDDAATALLMVKFYEEHLGGGLPPAAALRRAQLWLRDLDASMESDFLAVHPALAAEFRRRRRAGKVPGRCGEISLKSSSHRPYAHPANWAGFIVIGA